MPLRLANLRSSEIFDDVAPWDFYSFDKVPVPCLTDKALRDQWINNPELDYHVYTLFEGVQKNLRLRSARVGIEENSPHAMLGVAGDYDVPMSIGEVIRVCERFGVKPPTWFEQTLSGNARLIWMFEKPLLLPCRRYLKLLLEKIHEFLPIDRIAGLDKGAFETPERYFTNGARWVKVSDYVVPNDELIGWTIKATEKFDWVSKELGKAVDLKAVAEECRRIYPRFAEWQGDFVDGAQGPSFWLEGSKSPKSAIVHLSGMSTFSGSADKKFYPWPELVGKEFVDTSEQLNIGKAVEGIYYDGKNFVLKLSSGKIVFENRQNLELTLRVRRGLSDRKPKGGHSDLELAIAHIIDKQRIDGATSCAFYPHGVFEFQGKTILNTHQVEALKPADKGTWGPSGDFPFISAFLDTVFDPVHPQLEFFLGWLKLFYQGCLYRKPTSGHSVFLCGPVNTGKTFLNLGIVADMVGGHAPANEYLTGSDNFNGEMFDRALWSIDDGSVTTSAAIHRIFSEKIKRASANRHHRVNDKFLKAVVTPWQGRIFVTCNDDAISIRIIPDLSLSIREKLMIFRAGKRSVQFMEQPEMEALLKRELPHFCRWILDWEIPASCLVGSDVRFGIASYCEESLGRSANRSSNISVFSELLSNWLRQFFQSETNRNVEFWEGSATELRISMSNDPVFAELLRAYRPESMPQMLAMLQQQQSFQITIHDDGDDRIFRIAREARFMRKTGAPLDIPQSDGKFQKR